MTSGSYSFGNGYPFRNSRVFKTWSGGDGRSEIVDGKMRTKWNNYSMTFYQQSAQSGTASDTVGGSGSGAVVWPASAELRIQSKLVKQIKGHDFNLAVNVAQGRQLVDMSVRNIQNLGLALVDVKHGRFTQAARRLGVKSPTISGSRRLTARDVSGRWLELIYGWLPAINDTYEAAKAYEAITKVRINRVYVKGTSVFDQSDFSNSPSQYTYPGRKITHKYIIYEMTEDISGYRSIGLEDPLTLAWEVIPYSFVLDWFLPIGSYLENLNVIPLLKGRFCSTRFGQYQASFGVGLTPGTKGASRTEFGLNVVREITPGLNTQKPTFVPLPKAMSPRRIFSAVALAHQRLSR